MKNTAFILIHGAGLGSFVWDEMKPHLALPAIAINFPGRSQSDEEKLQISFPEYTSYILEQIKGLEFEKFIIVAHSVGGCLGLKIAEHLGSKLAGFIAVSAVIPKDGKSFISCLPFPQRIILPIILSVAGSNPPQKAIEAGLCNDLGDGKKAMVVKNFKPESKFLFTQKCHASIPRSKKLYIKLTEDKEIAPPMQDKMARNLQSEVAVMSSGHLPMLSKPIELAKLLNSFAVPS